MWLVVSLMVLCFLVLLWPASLRVGGQGNFPARFRGRGSLSTVRDVAVLSLLAKSADVDTETSIAARQQNPSINQIDRLLCKDLYIATKWDFRSPRCWPHGGGMERRSEYSWY
jgi:hypothetical protein